MKVCLIYIHKTFWREFRLNRSVIAVLGNTVLKLINVQILFGRFHPHWKGKTKHEKSFEKISQHLFVNRWNGVKWSIIQSKRSGSLRPLKCVKISLYAFIKHSLPYVILNLKLLHMKDLALFISNEGTAWDFCNCNSTRDGLARIINCKALFRSDGQFVRFGYPLILLIKIKVSTHPLKYLPVYYRDQLAQHLV